MTYRRDFDEREPQEKATSWYASGLFLGTAKVLLGIAIVSTIAANYLSNQVYDKNGMSRLASKVTNTEPLTTGTLGRKTNEVRIDPCVTTIYKQSFD